ncbi:hypothetical protein [Anaerolinea thermophila]|uniref:Uncharacterized protein n=1 Tax=Anaerolinea thermophila (strain DSM 14523 / JCM 11388 / NBRC 100420 / UNI-1) TaxID=926569 RepID=E8N5Q3_ANATU|nr:hypothetical protein [Anaerolinea thermophila]BAJ63767.1 hypothetical protein ANT_17410 [Anaerolinea thermophila UNI-1]
MNKQTWSIFFIFAFALSLWFGFLVAIRMEQLGLIHFSASTSTEPQSQVNYLLIEVDSLTSRTPVFQSAWIALRYQSSTQSALHLIRIDTSEEFHTNLQNAFQVRQNKLGSKFTKHLTKKGYEWGYFIVVDQESLKTLKLAFPKEISDSTENNLKGLLSATCQVLGARPILSYPVNFDTLKEHIVTNWTKDLANKEWERLTASPKTTRCEWYPTN